jgi:hypothetical protein
MAGTYNYIALEEYVLGKFMEKTDNFSFGTVVLEVICGQRALPSDVQEDEMILVN